MLCTARKHLKAERTRTGKRIEHAGALDTFGQRTLEHRGDGLAHAIGRGAAHIAPLGAIDGTTAPLPSNDPHPPLTSLKTSP